MPNQDNYKPLAVTGMKTNKTWRDDKHHSVWGVLVHNCCTLWHSKQGDSRIAFVMEGDNYDKLLFLKYKLSHIGNYHSRWNPMSFIDDTFTNSLWEFLYFWHKCLISFDALKCNFCSNNLLGGVEITVAHVTYLNQHGFVINVPVGVDELVCKGLTSLHFVQFSNSCHFVLRCTYMH